MADKNIKLSDHFTYGRLLRFVAPSALMFVFMSVYSVVDGYFVSNFTGKTEFAAVNFIMPFIMLLATPGFMLGTGGSALVSMTLGQGNSERANRLFSFFCYVAVGAGAVMSVLSYLLMPTVATLLGAEGELHRYAVQYGRIIVTATTPQTLHYFFESFNVTAERPQLGLRITLASGITNIVLDFLFVYVFRWGVAGAAVATAISQYLAGLIPFIYFLLPNGSLLRCSRPRWDGRALLRACTNGVSELMTNISMSVVGMVYNFRLMEYFGEDGIAAYGVIMYVNFIFIALFIGYSVGTAPIVGFHFGAGNRSELNNILRKSVLVLSIGGVLMLAAGEIFARPLALLYVAYDEALLEMTVHGFRVFSVSFLFCGLAIFGSSFFTALNDGFTSAAISFLRTLVFELLSVLLLPLVFGGEGIWYAVIVAEFMAVAVSTAFLIIKRKKYGYFERN